MKMTYDALNSFGAVSLVTSPYTGANILAHDGDVLENYKVDLFARTDAAGGTSAVFKLQGSADGSSWTDLAATGSIALASLKAADGKRCASITIPETAEDYKQFRILVVPTGTFTAGTFEALLNTAIGV
jgi:hypothetical protein